MNKYLKKPCRLEEISTVTQNSICYMFQANAANFFVPKRRHAHKGTQRRWWNSGFNNFTIKQYVLPDTINADHQLHDDVIKWKDFPRYWPFVQGINRSPVNSPHKGQWRGAVMFLIYTWTHGWSNNRDAGGLRRYHAHHDITVMSINWSCTIVTKHDIALNRAWCAW